MFEFVAFAMMIIGVICCFVMLGIVVQSMSEELIYKFAHILSSSHRKMGSIIGDQAIKIIELEEQLEQYKKGE